MNTSNFETTLLTQSRDSCSGVLFVTHAQWAGGRPFPFSARAGRAGVVLRNMPGRAGGRLDFVVENRVGVGGRPVF